MEPAKLTLSGSLNIPRSIVIQLLEDCNLRCPMCYQWGEQGYYQGKQQLAQLDIDVVKQIISDCSPAHPYYNLFGGEPFMYPRLDEVIAALNRTNSRVEITTNGMFLEEYAEMLVTYKVDRIWVSLDGPAAVNDRQRGPGVFGKVMKGIDKITETRRRMDSGTPKIGIHYIVTPLNYLHIKELFCHCFDISLIDYLSIEFQIFITPPQYESYARTLKEEFDVPDAPSPRAVLTDSQAFSSIDTQALSAQMEEIKEYCAVNHVNFFSFPKTTTPENINHFFAANLDKMADRRTRCPLPWIYTEICANGDVVPCPTFYDLSFGNVNRQGILAIWNSPSYHHYRNFMKKKIFDICPTACTRYYW